jgi:hypothetical protein
LSEQEAQNPQPPQPPESDKKLQFYRLQQIAIPLLMLLPILALLGLFGESSAEASEANEALSVHVEYTTRSRYRLLSSIEVSLQNISSEEIAALTIGFDADYIGQFSELSFEPSLDEISNGLYQIHMENIKPGETRQVTAEFKGEHYGRHQGEVRINADAVEDIAIPISTFIFP